MKNFNFDLIKNPFLNKKENLVPKITYGGSIWNPTEWTEEIGEIAAGVSPDENADGWFVSNGLVHRCIKDGTPTFFFDKEFWFWKED